MTCGRFFRALALAAATALWLGGCGGSSSSKDAGCKISPFTHKCAWTACTTSVAAECASGTVNCVMTWPSDVTAFCSAYPDATHYSGSVNCGAYREFSEISIESGRAFYYSAQTGKLVAIVDGNGQFQTSSCRGGPSDFVPPTCDLYKSFTCPDAGP